MINRSTTIIITIVVGLASFMTSCTGAETQLATDPPTSLPQSTSTSIPSIPTSTRAEDIEPTALPTPTAEPIPFLPAGMSAITPDNAANLQRITTLAVTGVSVVAFSPDGRLLATGTFGEGAVILWDLTTGELVHTLKGHVNPRVLYYLAFSPDGRRLISGALGWEESNDNMILWDVISGERVRTYDGHPGALSHDWRSLAISTTGGREGDTLTFFNFDLGDEKYAIATETEILGVTFSPDDLLLATRLRETWRSPIVLWDLKTLREVRWLYDWHFFTFSPNGNSIAAIIDDGGERDIGELKIFNMEDWSDNQVLAGGADALWYLPPTFSPEGRILTASFSSHLRVWDTENWEELNRLTIPEKSGTAFSPDGRILVTFSHNHAVQLWGIVP
ncbi:MAG: hypothetical protein GTO14_15800 [Anaerolineales bacterium]|nr:hypothetical protein [Anaerolineales bacterium]